MYGASLRIQLLRLLFVVAAIPVLLFSVGSLRRSYVYQRDAVTRSLEDRASGIQRRLDDYLAKHVSAIQALARTVPSGPPAYTPQWTNLLGAYQELYPGFLTMMMAGPTGRVAIFSRVGGQPSSAEGLNNVSDREYFAAAMGSQKPYISAAFRGRGLGTDPLVGISSRFEAPSGTPGGIVEGSLDLHRLGDFVNDYSGQLTLILDRSNRVTYASPALPFKALQDLSGSPLTHVQSGSVVRYGQPDRSYIVGLAPVESSFKWRVVVFYPSALFYQAFTATLRTAAMALIAGCAICFITARLAARRAALP